MSNKLFTQVPVPKFPNSTFSQSRSVMFTPRMQKLYCPNIVETLPGDGINERTEHFARTQPMVAPTFAKINADQFAFFVPFWQINEHFDDFITGGEKGDYHDKLPWTTISDIYGLIIYLLSISQGSGATEEDFASWLEDTTLDHPLEMYSFLIEYVQSIIEHIDLLRALPLKLPDFIIPTLQSANVAEIMAGNLEAFEELNGNLEDSTLRINYAPFVAYLKVWCEYFRDENLCEDYFDTLIKHNKYTGGVNLFDSVGQVYISSIIPYTSIDWADEDSIEDICRSCVALFGVLPRAWKKDYFTAALPFTQKGPEVLIPIAGTFPVEFHAPDAASGPSDSGTFIAKASSGSAGLFAEWSGTERRITGTTTLDSSGLGTTIQELRRAERLEEFYEADARGGNRYPENTLMQWGVRTPDSRLPRSIYLGMNTSPVSISEVVQTSSTESQPTPQGTLAGKGISYGNNRLSRYYYTMHGFLLNLYSLRCSALYEQGVHPMFSRFDRTEYAWPRFAHLGEQPVYLKELYVDDTVQEDDVFGYEPRYSEYKSEKSSVHGLLKGSLNFWTMSRRFDNAPVLNEEFIYGPPRLDNFAVVNPLQPPFIVEIDYRVRSNRKLPFFGVPML